MSEGVAFLERLNSTTAYIKRMHMMRHLQATALDALDVFLYNVRH